ncbi:MAG: hypothetical protein WCO04_06035 [Pseudomonadota bacterium]
MLNAVISPYFELVNFGKILTVSNDFVTLDRGYLTVLLRPQIEKIQFDEDYYRKRNPDIQDAELRGEITDLHSHYLNFGFFENRLPCLVEVDGFFYARAYPDVAVALLEGRTPSCQTHFETSGFAEGRLPRDGWRFSDLLKG